MSKEYEISLVLKVRATDASKALRLAEHFIVAARRFNGATLSLRGTDLADFGSTETSNGQSAAPLAAVS